MNTMKLIKHNVGQLTGFIISMYVAYMLGTGKILNYISIADPLNEMAMFMLCMGCAVFSLMCLENPIKNQKS